MLISEDSVRRNQIFMASKIKKIILLVDIPFTTRDYDRFGVKILEDNGFEVEIWDCSYFLCQDVLKKVEISDLFTFKKHRLFATYQELCTAILNLDCSSFIFLFPFYRPETYKIYRYISRKKIKYGIEIVGCCYPLSSIIVKEKVNPILLLVRKLKKIKKLNFPLIKEWVIRYTPYKFLGIKPVNLVVAGGARTFFDCYPISKKSEILWSHYFDYDIYLNERQNSHLINNQKIAIFLDQYYPFHQDWVFCKDKPPINSRDYYHNLCDFFNYIEKHTGAEIIIAAHPRSNYEQIGDCFEGRKVLKGQTARLVKESEFVLAHSTYAVNFAVLFKKPVFFLTNDIIKQHSENIAIETMANLLGKEPINLSKPFMVNWERELSIDKDRYDYYKHSFIKKNGTEELPFWQIVANRIKLLV